MATTTHMGITLLEQSQSQKEVTMNQALARLDAVMNSSAKSRTTATPPGSPAAGDVYIVGASPTGDWTSHAGHIAYYDQLWRFITPNKGMTLWVDNESLFYTYDGSAWTAAIVVSTTSCTRNLWIPAYDMVPSTTNGCAVLAQLEIAANQPNIRTLNFDASTEEYAQVAVSMRGGWNEGTLTAALYWSHASTSTNFGVVWGVQAVAASDNDALGVAFGTAQTVTDTGGTTNNLYVSAQTSDITVGGTPAAGDVCFFRIYRKAADAADTMTIDARLHGIKLFYTLNNYSDV